MTKKVHTTELYNSSAHTRGDQIKFGEIGGTRIVLRKLEIVHINYSCGK